jgi:hypothetical protein
MATIPKILLEKFPNTQWTITENDYSSLIWDEVNTITKPSEEEILSYSDEVDITLEWKIVRKKRNELLQNSDWTQLLDSDLTPEKTLEWREYRTELRSIPQNFSNPFDVVFPSTP